MTMSTAKGDWVRLRGGPGWDYPCDNPCVTECALAQCQKAKRCRLKDYFATFRNGECAPDSER
jgi:hypothetical protein